MARCKSWKQQNSWILKFGGDKRTSLNSHFGRRKARVASERQSRPLCSAIAGFSVRQVKTWPGPSGFGNQPSPTSRPLQFYLLVHLVVRAGGGACKLRPLTARQFSLSSVKLNPITKINSSSTDSHHGEQWPRNTSSSPPSQVSLPSGSPDDWHKNWWALRNLLPRRSLRSINFFQPTRRDRYPMGLVRQAFEWPQAYFNKSG